MIATKIKFSPKEKTDFYVVLKQRINAYFEENGITRYANGAMVFKTVFMLSVLIGSYLLLVLGDFGFWISALLYINMGLFTAFAAVNICHDAIHGAYSPNKWVTMGFKYLFNVLGANAYIWDISHNQIHHTYTNVPGEDKDLDLTFLVRLVPSQKRMAIHRFQHIYVFVIYAVSTLIWVFLKDYLLFFGKKYNLRQKKEFLPELAKMVFFKFVYYGIYLAIPLFVLSLPVWQIVLAFVLMHVFEGLALALMFSLAHLVEEATFPVPDEKGRIENIWAIHQLQTTANFCIDNPLINFFTGGLNFQVEHHLFSHICHIHYRPLSDIVRQTAKEYHVPYRTKDSLVEAMGSHIGLLKRMGREDAPVFATPSLN